MTALVTGGLGFIGSHLTDKLMSKGDTVHVFDNLTTGTKENVEQWLSNADFTLIEGDLLNSSDLAKLRHENYDTIFHLAANPEVRVGSTNPDIHFQQNVVATQNLLEYLRKTQDTPTLVFTSTSTVYGEPAKIPTLANYAPSKPISINGASKLASETLISAYAHAYGFKVIIFRLVNMVGPRSQRGAIHDSIQDSAKTPKKPEIISNET